MPEENIMKTLRNLGLALAATLFATTAHAMPMLDFDVDGSGSSVDVSGLSLCLFCSFDFDLVPNLDDETFSLGVGDTYTFDFFTVNAAGFIGGAAANVEATLAFDDPMGASATGEGTGAAGFFFGIISGGALTWQTQPGDIVTPGGSFNVTFSDIADFSILDPQLGGVVQATVEVTEIANGVPEPGTLALFGLGALLIGLRRRRTL